MRVELAASSDRNSLQILFFKKKGIKRVIRSKNASRSRAVEALSYSHNHVGLTFIISVVYKQLDCVQLCISTWHVINNVMY